MAPRRKKNFSGATGGIGFDPDIFGTQVANFVAARITTLNQATWNAWVMANVTTAAQAITILQALIKAIPDFDGDAEPT